MSAKRRARLHIEADGKCHWCGVETLLTPEPCPRQATEDHVIPRGRGGSNDDTNVVLACHGCNQMRNMLDQKAKSPRRKKAPTVMVQVSKDFQKLHEQVKTSRDQALRRFVEEQKRRKELEDETLRQFLWRRYFSRWYGGLRGRK